MPKVSVNNINNVNSEKIQGDQGDQGEQSDQGGVRIYFEKITLHFILYLHSGSAFFADMTHTPVVQVSWRNTVIRLKECDLHTHQDHERITRFSIPFMNILLLYVKFWWALFMAMKFTFLFPNLAKIQRGWLLSHTP